MPPFVDLTGKRYERWVVLRRVENNVHNQPQYLCKCVCGIEKVVRSGNLTTGESKSCGCLNKENKRLICVKRNTTHGLSDTHVHIAWVNMRQRCSNPKTKGYKSYGGRGIRVCKRWDSFEFFLEDMGYPPSKKHTMDRIDVNGPYSPENCRWAIMKTQQNNRTNNRLLTFNGEHKNLQEWADIVGISRETISRRIDRGWSVERAFTKVPINGRSKITS